MAIITPEMYNYLKYAVFMLFYINLDIYCEYMNI